jgi:hypothetical protein
VVKDGIFIIIIIIVGDGGGRITHSSSTIPSITTLL